MSPDPRALPPLPPRIAPATLTSQSPASHLTATYLSPHSHLPALGRSGPHASEPSRSPSTTTSNHFDKTVTRCWQELSACLRTLALSLRDFGFARSRQLWSALYNILDRANRAGTPPAISLRDNVALDCLDNSHLTVVCYWQELPGCLRILAFLCAPTIPATRSCAADIP